MYQSFELLEDKLAKMPPEKISKLKTANAAKTLREMLQNLGYNVLESSTTYNGIPCKVLIGREGMTHKQDFSDIANNLGIPFKSGDAYMDFSQTPSTAVDSGHWINLY